MKFCFATTATALSTDFVDSGFSEVNPCFLQHHAGVCPQKCGCTIPWDCGHLLHLLTLAWSRGDEGTMMETFSVCVEILVFLSRKAAPAHLPCCAESGSQCHRLVCRECAHVCGRAPTQGKTELFTIFAKEFQDHTRWVVSQFVEILLELKMWFIQLMNFQVQGVLCLSFEQRGAVWGCSQGSNPIAQVCRITVSVGMRHQPSVVREKLFSFTRLGWASELNIRPPYEISHDLWSEIQAKNFTKGKWSHLCCYHQCSTLSLFGMETSL